MADAKFKPFIADDQIIPEFSAKAIILGAIFGLIFGAATVYLALRAGLTVSASIPIAVLAIAVFKRFGKSTILENNIVQTIGSAGESVAAGVAFTIPALIFLAGGEAFFNYFNIFTLALVGGILGVLFMVPLRRSLIVKEHGTLPYPEGTACAEVLVAGERGGSLAGKVFAGLGIAFLYKSFMSILGLWKDVPGFAFSRNSAFPNASVAAEITPEYLGVGYIIGPRIAGVLVAGGVLSALVLVPLISYIGDALPTFLKPGMGDLLISQMTPTQIRLGYARYIGAGAVAAAGLITLIRTLPTIVSAFRDSFKNLKDAKAGVAQTRTERDIPITYVILGSLALVIIVAILPQLPGTFPGTMLMGLLVVVFGFFFVTVSSRIVGIIGSSSNPISGMTIATLMATCLIFVGLGWTGESYQSLAMAVGGIVCIAAANAGATSQDLKTGYIVGATPIYQQLGLVIGVVVSTFVIGWTLQTIDNSMQFEGVKHAIGSDRYAAPQATLMATIIKGLLAQDLPWGLVFVGMFISVVVELCGVRSLSFAVGAYLPLSTTAPIFVGGLMKALADKMAGHKAGHEESEVSSGMLYSTGLVAGGSLTGVAIALLSGISTTNAQGTEISILTWVLDLVGIHGWESMGGWADIIGLVFFSGLCFMLLRAARQKLS
ncbi:oligopeptide transporter, OPT family [candidate division KSB1 bacterium]|nr:MAG: oligopeptide transporter, OPT family [candidate division KSB1 bacterium]MCE7940302.1 oligopeptide transporter, OPT family [Chlorobi bacterium CHB1]MDL1875716.1 oligopeptide transporter, OPT family [Cytophagia bacterium CHB2]